MLTKPLKTPHSPDQVACPVSLWLGGIKDDDKKPAVHSAILSGGGGGDEWRKKACPKMAATPKTWGWTSWAKTSRQVPNMFIEVNGTVKKCN